jgi:hypothetical protein
LLKGSSQISVKISRDADHNQEVVRENIRRSPIVVLRHALTMPEFGDFPHGTAGSLVKPYMYCESLLEKYRLLIDKDASTYTTLIPIHKVLSLKI